MRSPFLMLMLAAVQGASTPAPGTAQARRVWNDPAAAELVGRATARRGAQLADTGLTDYRASARGYVTFLAQFGEGFVDPPQVVRTDQLAVEVYWRAPNRSKQRVVGRRAALSKPTDIAYHRDHLVIVQNNFPAIIRLGDGDEVRDVPHPLSVAGGEAYEFAAADSLTIRVGDRVWDVVALDFRPRDPAAPRAIGTVYLDRETASVIRLAIGFTRAALIDPALEDVAVVLDNGLVDGRFWLPRRQEIEIRRTGTWLDFPARGIIRGEWDLCCVTANVGLPPERFAGPEIAFAPAESLAAYPFEGRLTDSISARALGAGADRAAALVQRRATLLVAHQALMRPPRRALAAGSVSDFIRANRVEGLALGAGLRLPIGAGASARLFGRYGLDDAVAKGRAIVARDGNGGRVALTVQHDFAAAGDVPEVSGLGNSIGWQEFGADATDDYGKAGAAMEVGGGIARPWAIVAEAARERPLDVHARPRAGAPRPAFPAERVDRARLMARVASSASAAEWRLEWRAVGSVSMVVRDTQPGAASRTTVGRANVDLRVSRRVSGGELSARAVVTAATALAPRQDWAVFGGPQTGPGYAVHSVTGVRGGAVRSEWRVPVGARELPLGRFGRTQVEVAVIPFAGLAVASAPERGSRLSRYLGVGVVTLYDAIRIDLARGVDRGGGWEIRADFGRSFWPVL